MNGPGENPARDPLGVHAAPTLSIGLAVYNGERHLREAIDSLLAQDLTDLELIISDNASTDGTAAICEGYAAVDSRVRYSRNETNIGAAENFNRVFELARGRYFMWGSDDDVWSTCFARLCIERLEQSPHAVMCGGYVDSMTDEGVVLAEQTGEGLDTEDMGVAARVHKMTSRLLGSDIYAVIRPEALRSTNLFRRSIGPDTLLVLELLLLGESLCVPDVLLHKRLPPTPKTAGVYIEEIDPSRSSDAASEEMVEPLTYAAREVLATVRASNLDPSVVAEIEGDFVDTLSFENLFWRQFILDEQRLDLEDLPTPRAVRAAIRKALRLPADTVVRAGDSAIRTPWRVRQGVRLLRLRRTLLRILQPFVDGQNLADAENGDLLHRLSGQVDRLERRVRDLERHRYT